MSALWKGFFPPPTTQFKADLSLDLDATASHLETLIQSGVDGLVMLGSLGENASLTREEKREVMRVAISTSAGRVPVLSGVAELSGDHAATYVRDLEALGADGAMVMPAMAFRPDPDEVVAHYSRVADATSLPLMLYNNPISYHADATPEILKALAKHENYVAIKESSGDPRRVTEIVNALGDRYTIFGGVDDLILECALQGATGWVAGVGLAFPVENQQMWKFITTGDWESAVKLNRWYAPLLHLDIGTKFVQNIKLAMQEVGMGKEYVRLPRVPLVGADREYALRVIKAGLESRPTF